MFLIHTENSAQRERLQQQYQTQNGLIAIPAKQFESLFSLINSITYQYFHKEPPVLAIKMQQYIAMTLKMHHSLQIYKEIMKIIKDYEDKLMIYQQYILKMNRVINEQNCSIQLQQSLNHVQSANQLFDQSLLREHHSSSILQMIDIPILPFESAKDSANNQQIQSQITKNSNSSSSNQYIKQTLDSINKLNNFFYSASAIYNRDDWKTERSAKKQDSKEIDSFKKKGENIVEVNSSLKNLIANQMAYDIKRSIQESIPKTKQLKQMEQAYNKKIKESLFFSKISLRRKK